MGTLTHGASTAAARDIRGTASVGGRILSNGRYSTLLTHAGTGVSTFADHALTRGSADRLEDHAGFVVWLRDPATGAFASLGLEPAGEGAERYETGGTPGSFWILRVADGLEARLDVCVCAGHDAELRRVTLVNRSARPRRVEVTTAADVVLNHPAADAGHPAFSKLFVQTEYAGSARAILARRRPRGNDETHPVLVHALLEPGPVTHESDRMRFVGRGRSAARPLALAEPSPLAGTTGNVLDPLVSLRREVELGPGASATLTFVLGAASDRDAALALVATLGADPGGEFARAGEAEHVRLAREGWTDEQAIALQALAVAMHYGHPALRAAPAWRMREAADVADLSHLALRGGAAIVLAMPPALAPPGEPARLAAAERYWRSLGLDTQVVIVGSAAPTVADEGVRHVTHDQLGPAGFATLASLATAVLTRPLLEVAAEVLAAERLPAPRRVAPPASAVAAAAPNGETLRQFNGHGGFNADGTEYVVRMPWEAGQHRLPPLPWVNVIANPSFGFVVSETGAGTTWSQNSREHRLTPWHNDPVLDPHGEALYLRDEDSGAFWSPLAGPAPQPTGYEMRHGFGYSISRHSGDGLDQEVTLFAHRDAPLRLTRVRVTNRGVTARHLSFVAYQRLVLGVTPQESAPHVVSWHEPGGGLLLATNPLAGEFADRVAVAASVAPAGAARQWTADRESFLGAGGSVARPVALAVDSALDARAGAGLDPCFVERLVLAIEPGATAECTFLLGEFGTAAEARSCIEALREPGAVERALEDVRAFWNGFVSGVRIETPEPALDLMVNGWLAYQTLSCRIWGRTAFYQSGGAFGFRDQLQDATCLLHLSPALAREQILLHAAHQFLEGDVLHWWHPPLAKGIRTRFADDLLWLPLLTAYYVSATGDWGVLDERARFLEARALEPGEDEAFLVPRDSGRGADVYEHCCRAIDRSFTLGAHGLPLFGTGDWNDGMNRVGREGRGESVWMGFFLFAILGDFVPLCERRGDQERASLYAGVRDHLRVALNDGGWDGEWYRRAYYDNGEPLGSKQSDECRIDGLAQAWAVISKAAPPERAHAAMEAAERHLVSERDGLIRLLTPAFQHTPNDPGYIKGYVPGVRENGGQYTHAALWVVRAAAELGRADVAARWLAMLSPVSHTSDPARLAIYRTEPYVIAADVYGEAPHVGRGGWSWYTGSAGWMLRVAIESVLGIQLVRGESLLIRPCTPALWPEYRVRYRVPGGSTTYEITVRCPDGRAGAVREVVLDGGNLAPERGSALVPLLRDGGTHRLEITLGEAPVAVGNGAPTRDSVA